jgi:hypothetical protein
MLWSYILQRPINVAAAGFGFGAAMLVAGPYYTPMWMRLRQLGFYTKIERSLA